MTVTMNSMSTASNYLRDVNFEETVEVVRYQFLTADDGMSLDVCQDFIEVGLQIEILVICPVIGAAACLQGIICSSKWLSALSVCF